MASRDERRERTSPTCGGSESGGASRCRAMRRGGGTIGPAGEGVGRGAEEGPCEAAVGV